MRREKNGMPLCSSSPANWKMSESCRKKARCSGKNRSKRVRLICRVSAVVPEKSGLSVTAAVSEGVIFQNTSSEGSRKSSSSSVSWLRVAPVRRPGHDVEAVTLVQPGEPGHEPRARQVLGAVV